MNPPTLFRPSIVRPVWSDPGYMLAVSAMRVTDFTPTAGTSKRCAPADPNRWAIGFIRSTTNFDTVNVGPWGDADSVGILIPANGVLLWFKLFDYGPMVVNEWFVSSTGGSPVRIVEIYNP